jgi:hypothetical protein
MDSAYWIDGYAITSVEGMIADADKAMPQTLKYEADHQFFMAALEEVDLIAHGRHSHEGHPRSHLRRRFWMTHTVAALQPMPDEPRQWLWNPAGIAIDDACRKIGLDGGVVAILGGTAAYDMFLDRYRAFNLCRAGRTDIPGGTPAFSEMRAGLSAPQVLSRHGLSAEPPRILDAANDVALTRWVRR